MLATLFASPTLQLCLSVCLSLSVALSVALSVCLACCSSIFLSAPRSGYHSMHIFFVGPSRVLFVWLVSISNWLWLHKNSCKFQASCINCTPRWHAPRLSLPRYPPPFPFPPFLLSSRRVKGFTHRLVCRVLKSDVTFVHIVNSRKFLILDSTELSLNSRISLSCLPFLTPHSTPLPRLPTLC